MSEDVRTAFWRALRARHPGLREALLLDAQVAARHRGERDAFRSRLDAAVQIARLAWVSDAFLGQALYRAKARLQARGVPVLPRLAHRLAMTTALVSVGDPIVMAPGVYIAHGQVVIDGITEVGTGVFLAPFVTIGLVSGDVRGPTIAEGAMIGTGARIL